MVHWKLLAFVVMCVFCYHIMTLPTAHVAIPTDPSPVYLPPIVSPPQVYGCNVRYHLSAQRWIDEEMDIYLEEWIAAHPECNNAEDGWYNCYAETVGYGGFYCLLGTGNCNSESYCASDIRIYYTLTAISHLGSWYNNLYQGIQYAFSESVSSLPTLTMGLGLHMNEDWFVTRQMFDIVVGLLGGWVSPVKLPIRIITNMILEKWKMEQGDSRSLNFKTIADAIRHYWRSALEGVDNSFQDILQNSTLFADVVKGGSYLPNPSTYTSIASIDAIFLPVIIMKYTNIILHQQMFTILNGSDPAFGLGPDTCILDKEANNTWNSWLDPNTQTCWVWGVDRKFNKKNRQPLDSAAKFLFVDGNYGQPFTTPENLVLKSIECNTGTTPGSPDDAFLYIPPVSDDFEKCVFDFPVCYSSRQEGCSVIEECRWYWPWC